MISTVNLSVQFGEKPLFENVSIKFSNGNRYGLIGANGCGKSTFMKLKRFLLRYYPPGIILEYEQQAEVCSQKIAI